MILYNPQVDDFLGSPPHFKLLRRKPLKKYGFHLDETIARNEVIRVLVDGAISAFVPASIFRLLPLFIRRWLAGLEFEKWVELNGLAGKVTRVAESDISSGDIIFAFSYKAATGDFQRRAALFEKARHVVFHLSHYFVATKEKSANLSTLRNAILAGDSDISENFYFRKFFHWYRGPFLVMPFCVAPRFQVNNKEERQPTAVATGSFHDLTQEVPQSKVRDFMESTGETTYHPLRRTLYEQKDQLQLIDVYASPYRPQGKKSTLKRWRDHFWVAQKSYFSIDIVQLYNQHRYAIVGEELSGFPALGAFEAIACGCTLIAQPHAYQGLGLTAGLDFLVHDGSVEHIESIIASGQQVAPARLEDIARRFRSQVVHEQWRRAIASLRGQPHALQA